MSKEHIKAVFLITIYGILAGVFISTGHLYLVLIGIVYLLIDVLYEYAFLMRIDTRKDVEMTKQTLDKYIQEAKEISEEIEDMKNKIFNAIYSDPMNSIEERIQHLEDKTNEIESNVAIIKNLNENMEREFRRR